MDQQLEFAECTCCVPRRPITRPKLPQGETNNEEWMHVDDEQFAVVIHAHVEESSTDCDGRHGHSHIVLPGPLTTANPSNDECVFHTAALELVLPIRLNEFGTKIEINETTATWSLGHDEGGASGQIRFCTDPDCSYDEATNYDQFAEAARY